MTTITETAQDQLEGDLSSCRRCGNTRFIKMTWKPHREDAPRVYCDFECKKCGASWRVEYDPSPLRPVAIIAR